MYLNPTEIFNRQNFGEIVQESVKKTHILKQENAAIVKIYTYRCWLFYDARLSIML